MRRLISAVAGSSAAASLRVCSSKPPPQGPPRPGASKPSTATVAAGPSAPGPEMRLPPHLRSQRPPERQPQPMRQQAQTAAAPKAAAVAFADLPPPTDADSDADAWLGAAFGEEPGDLAAAPATSSRVPTAAGGAAIARPLDGSDGDDAVVEVIDDAETFFPPLPEPSAVAGQRLVPPGFVRYRFEVQYRGDSFPGGWSKSMRKAREVAAAAAGDTGASGGGAPAFGATQRLAQDAFRDALCVAMDVDDLRIIPGSLPEAGVHCRRLACHVDVPASVEMQPRTVLQRAHLWMHKKGDKGGILTFARCRPEFSAVHSAVRRVYLYRILNRIAPPQFDVGTAWHVDRHLNEAAMQRAASLLEGTHDFGAFVDIKMARSIARAASRSAGAAPSESLSATHTVRTLERLSVVRQDDEVLLWFVGRSFLRHQIRHLVSILKMVGQGLWTDADVAAFARRGFSGKMSFDLLRPPPAPVHGLTLWELQYPTAAPPVVDSGPLEPDAEEAFADAQEGVDEDREDGTDIITTEGSSNEAAIAARVARRMLSAQEAASRGQGEAFVLAPAAGSGVLPQYMPSSARPVAGSGFRH